LAALVPVAPAFAHHVMDGALPNTAWLGLLSGLGHPIVGIDHLAFVLGVGLLAYLAGHVVLMPLVFVAGTLAGCVLHLGGYNLPAPELVIALTVAVAAGLVATRAQLPIGALWALLAAAGVFHGYAYGESIVGAETGPLAAYMTGFGVIQSAIAVGTAVMLRAIVRHDYLHEATAMRLAGGVMALVAASTLATAAFAG
jgi:urease accessory protein